MKHTKRYILKMMVNDEEIPHLEKWITVYQTNNMKPADEVHKIAANFGMSKFKFFDRINGDNFGFKDIIYEFTVDKW